MKANEAPEKLYIALSELTEDGRTFVLNHRVDYPICIEYTRTDAFIEKACAWIKENNYWDWMNNSILSNKDLIKDFIKYMTEEV